MKKAILLVTILTAGFASFAFADETAAPADATETALVQPEHHHRDCHHEKHKHGPMAKAMHHAFESCKTAGIGKKSCFEQLSTYLADFKPNS